MQIYLDACIVIYLVERHREYDVLIRAALRQRPEPQLCWTDLTRMETHVKPLRDGDLALLSHFEHFYSEPAALYVRLDRDVFDVATSLRARHRLKTPDALHLAAAIASGCQEFWTNDRHLENAADGRIAIVTFQ